MSGYVIVWTYEAAPGREDAFVAAYGPDGAWARLFAQAEGFIGVELYRDAEGRFLSLDRWAGEAAFDAFQARYGAAYRALDAEVAGLTARQARIGGFGAP